MEIKLIIMEPKTQDPKLNFDNEYDAQVSKLLVKHQPNGAFDDASDEEIRKLKKFIDEFNSNTLSERKAFLVVRDDKDLAYLESL